MKIYMLHVNFANVVFAQLHSRSCRYAYC